MNERLSKLGAALRAIALANEELPGGFRLGCIEKLAPNEQEEIVAELLVETELEIKVVAYFFEGEFHGAVEAQVKPRTFRSTHDEFNFVNYSKMMAQVGVMVEHFAKTMQEHGVEIA